MQAAPRAASWGVVLLLASALTAHASHSLVERVKDGPAAETIRESYRCLESGEASENDDTKLALYQRGKELAEKAIRQDEGDPDAHFAMFANWGRWLQIDGWFKNSFHLPALRRELDRTLVLNPNHADALAAEGGLYLQLPRFLGGDVTKAESFLLRSIENDPDAVGARLELADCYIQLRRPEEARPLAEAALRLAIAQDKPHFVKRANKMITELGPDPQHDEARR
jgi:tetratricopeptide (TPR) repeat protein